MKYDASFCLGCRYLRNLEIIYGIIKKQLRITDYTLSLNPGKRIASPGLTQRLYSGLICIRKQFVSKFIEPLLNLMSYLGYRRINLAFTKWISIVLNGRESIMISFNMI